MFHNHITEKKVQVLSTKYTDITETTY